MPALRQMPVFVVLVVLAAPTPLVLAGPPRFRLAVGDHLAYVRSVKTGAPGGASWQRRLEQLDLWCLDERDGRLLLLVSWVELPAASEPAAPPGGVPSGKRAGATQHGSDAQPAGLLLWIDERGQKELLPEMAPRLLQLDPPLEILPELCPSIETGPAWTTSANLLGRRLHCTDAGPDQRVGGHGRVDFTRDDISGVDDLLKRTTAGRYWFDALGGTVVRAETQQRDSTAGTGRETVAVLRSRDVTPPEWRQRRLREVERYLRGLRIEDDLLDTLLREPAQCEQILSRLNRRWSELLEEPPRDRDSPVRRLAEARRRNVAAMAPAYRERAALAEQWLHRPAAHWSLQDATGRTITSESVRDRVTVECFWSAASPASLHFFDTLRRLREEIPEADLRIVCLNVDDDLGRARAAATRCGAGLLHVFAGPPVGGSTPTELPVVRVLNRDGTIARVTFGWRPSLTAIVKPLLP